MGSAGDGGVWTEDEVCAAVIAYQDMLMRERQGKRVNKAAVNRELRKGLLSGRSRSSIEMRMCNISSVLSDCGEPYINGYKPRSHVGEKVQLMIRNAIDQVALTDQNGDGGPDQEAGGENFDSTPSREHKLILSEEGGEVHETDVLPQFGWARRPRDRACRSCGEPTDNQPVIKGTRRQCDRCRKDGPPGQVGESLSSFSWLECPDEAIPESLEEVGAHLLRRLFVGAVLRKNARPLVVDDHVEAIVRRLGLDGKTPCVLEVAGGLAGVTKERIRQIQTRYERRLERRFHNPLEPLPKVLSSAFELASSGPADLGLGEALKESGLTGHADWALDRLIRLADLSGHRGVAESLRERATACAAVDRKFEHIARLSRQAVNRAAQFSGFCHASALFSKFEELWRKEYPTESIPGRAAVRKFIMDGQSGIKDLPMDYYCLSEMAEHSKGVRIIGYLNRMLTVSSPLSIAELQDALGRPARRRRVPFDIPVQTLRGFLEWHPNFKIDGEDRVSTTLGRYEFRSANGDSNVAWIINQLSSSCFGFMTKTQMNVVACADGRNTSSVGAELSFAVEIKKGKRGAQPYYYLIGCKPEEGSVTEGLSVANAAVVPTEQVWSMGDDDTVTLKVEVGDRALAGMIGVPASDLGYTDIIGAEQFELLDSEGEQFGSVYWYEPYKQIQGLHTYFNSKSVKPGDVITFTFDLVNRIVIGDRK